MATVRTITINSSSNREFSREVEAKVWEKNGQKIVYFSGVVDSGASAFHRRQAEIGAWDVNAQAWKKNASAGSELREKHNAIKIVFADVMGLQSASDVEWLDFMAAN